MPEGETWEEIVRKATKIKSVAMFVHAKKRASQRYGLKFTTHERSTFVKMIVSGEATFLRKRSNRVSVFLVVYQEKVYKIVYDKSRKTIVTFLNTSENDRYLALEGSGKTVCQECLQKKGFPRIEKGLPVGNLCSECWTKHIFKKP